MSLLLPLLHLVLLTPSLGVAVLVRRRNSVLCLCVLVKSLPRRGSVLGGIAGYLCASFDFALRPLVIQQHPLIPWSSPTNPTYPFRYWSTQNAPVLPLVWGGPSGLFSSPERLWSWILQFPGDTSSHYYGLKLKRHCWLISGLAKTHCLIHAGNMCISETNGRWVGSLECRRVRKHF